MTTMAYTCVQSWNIKKKRQQTGLHCSLHRQTERAEALQAYCVHIQERTYMIKILAVVPYHGLESIIRQVAAEAEFADTEIIYEFGELDGGVDIARQYAQSDIDAIISRGGTARMIASVMQIPTFDIGISTNDLINTIALARNTQSRRMCLVGFSEITSAARCLDKLLDVPLEVYVTPSAQENIELMQKLRRENMELVIGDATSVRFARAAGINNIMISSGEDSVRSCLRKIQLLFAMCTQEHALALIERNVIHNLHVTYFLFGQDLTVLHSQVARDISSCMAVSSVQEISRSAAEHYLADRTQNKMTLEHNEQSFLISVRKDMLKGQEVLLTVWEKLNRLKDGARSLLQDLSQENSPFELESFVSRDNCMSQAIEDGKMAAAQPLPVIISGEEFSGRLPMARMIYNLSTFGKGGFYYLDASRFTPELLQELFERKRSILNALSLTLVVRNLQHTDSICREAFLQFVRSSGFCRHSRLICLLDDGIDSGSSAELSLSRCLISELGALMVVIPPLRRRTGDLMFLATLSLSQFCAQSGKNCNGFTPEAQQLLLQEPWEGNLHELRGVLRQVVGSLQGDYVTAPELALKLKAWKEVYRPHRTIPATEFLQGSLADIENKIILTVLREEQGHKSRVADRLKISRNTLWRKLKELGVAD